MWRVLVVILLLLLVIFPVIPVRAATDADVTLWATPSFGTGILWFTITYVGDSYLFLEWAVSVNVSNVMIRAKYSDYPSNIPNSTSTPSDGYLVYYGSGTSANDTSMDFDQNPGPLYYRAWAQKADGSWYVPTFTVKEVSKGVLAIFLAMLALGITGLSFWKRNIVLSLGASLSWLVLGIILVLYPDTISIATLSETWVQVLAFLFFSMSAGCAIYYLSGIGKTRITMSNTKGQSWQMWGKPPQERVRSRSTIARERHRDRLRTIRERRR